MKRLFSLGTILGGCIVIFSSFSMKNKGPVDYVNPYLGNISHLLVPTYPTIHLPNSMLRVYPQRDDYTADVVNGLPVAITSHRGSSAFNISPITGHESDLQSVKKYTYDLEKITPYRYAVFLDEEQVKVDFAPSQQSGIYSFNFEKEGNNYVVINVGNGSLKIDDDGAVSGWQTIIFDGEPRNKIYLYLEAEQEPNKIGVLSTRSLGESRILTEILTDVKKVGGKNKAVVFDFGDSRTIRLRYGISFISEEQAKRNLKREINTYNVDNIAGIGREIWNKTLGKIKVSSDDENDKVLFYTSLYRTYERMINISEDGKYYSAFDGKIHDDEGKPFYTDDWVWDTYRAAHPLRTLIEPEMETFMLQSYIRMAQQSPDGWMPTFPEITGDSHRMNGNHAVAVFIDAYNKGLRDFDLEAAYKSCKAALTEKSLLPWTKVPANELDKFYAEKGYFPALGPGEKETCKDVNLWEKRQPVAVTLGNCYDDWCLSQMANALGKDDDYRFFRQRSLNYRNLFNTKTAFFHPKDSKGNFIEPFDYRFAGGLGARDYYAENNGWVYRWDLQHNITDLISMMNGREQFVHNLNATFREPLGKGKYNFYAQLPDHTGNTGQFSMANEPGLHIPYLYNYAGQPWMTQKRIHTLINQWFRNDLMGISGDEDGGGMSAFVVFSMLGFYPVTPGLPMYVIGSPFFNEATITLSHGKKFRIKAINYSKENKYIQSAKLNGEEWNKPWFSHQDIENGGLLELVMGSHPDYEWGSAEENAPPAFEYTK